MGSWSVYCEISKITITSGKRMALIPLKKNTDHVGYSQWVPATLPIIGT